MDNFSELLREAIAGGDDLESAMRKAAATAAKEAVESLLQTEVRTLLGYGKYDPEGRNSGDSSDKGNSFFTNLGNLISTSFGYPSLNRSSFPFILYEGPTIWNTLQ